MIVVFTNGMYSSYRIIMLVDIKRTSLRYAKFKFVDMVKKVYGVEPNDEGKKYKMLDELCMKEGWNVLDYRDINITNWWY